MKIYIIGSLSNEEKIKELAKINKEKGNNISIEHVQKEDDLEKSKIIENCFRNIKFADLIIVVPKKDGTFGDGTLYEIEYAKLINKPIIIY